MINIIDKTIKMNSQEELLTGLNSDDDIVATKKKKRKSGKFIGRIFKRKRVSTPRSVTPPLLQESSQPSTQSSPLETPAQTTNLQIDASSQHDPTTRLLFDHNRNHPSLVRPCHLP
mmetsp:Transcript_63912/g.75652  ORF Transcript_63912/g.75652 Transcript_63912/m.75652 type:complete len:116 (-) Transcript_63912:891-1238(-)